MDDSSEGHESSTSAHTSSRISDKMASLLAPYMDKPKGWIFDHQDQLKHFIDEFGGEAVLQALEACLLAGKLPFFFMDFHRFRPSSIPRPDDRQAATVEKREPIQRPELSPEEEAACDQIIARWWEGKRRPAGLVRKGEER